MSPAFRQMQFFFFFALNLYFLMLMMMPLLHLPALSHPAGPRTYLQGEGQDHVGLGQRVLVLLAHVDDGGVVSSLQLLQLELSSLGHGHALQVGHELIHGGLELLDVHGLHLFRHKFGELAALWNEWRRLSRENQTHRDSVHQTGHGRKNSIVSSSGINNE